MGLVKGIFDTAVSNSSNCATWQDIEASHQAYHSKDMLTLGNFYGTLAFLAIGLTVAFILLLLENCVLCISAKSHQLALNRPASMYPTKDLGRSGESSFESIPMQWLE